MFGSCFGTLAVIFVSDVYTQNNQNKHANKTVCKCSSFSGQLGSPDLFPSKTFQRGPVLIPDKFEIMISTKQLLCKMVCTQCKKKVCETQSWSVPHGFTHLGKNHVVLIVVQSCVDLIAKHSDVILPEHSTMGRETTTISATSLRLHFVSSKLTQNILISYIYHNFINIYYSFLFLWKPLFNCICNAYSEMIW